MLRINEGFVHRWSTAYLDAMSEEGRESERRLFHEIGPRAQSQGFLSRGQLRSVVEWKSARSTGLLAKNSDPLVREVTRRAFEPGAVERLSTLTALHGVQDAVASAILTVWDPEHYTVWDYRARWTLGQANKLDERSSFGWYLAVCRSIADALEIEPGDISKLRLLDRALWQYKEHQPSP
jgi:hypothetical protein